MAAVSAAEEIRLRNETARILLIGEENEVPYNRPMLTKDFANSLSSEKIAIHDKAWYAAQRIVLLNKKVVALDGAAKSVKFVDGTALSYDKCIYALGATSFIPPFKNANLNEVVAIRSIADVAKIDHLVTSKTKNPLEAVVIGGGVLGLEAAWELKNAGCHVTVLELAPRVMMRQLDETASNMMQNLAAAQGIKVITNVKIDGMVGTTKVEGVQLVDGTLFPADLVIISCGIRPNVSIATAAGITLGRSIKVNEKMETNISGIYACGDCVEFDGVNYALWSSSLEMGKIAGANAAGEEKLYRYENPPLAFFGMNTSLYAVGDNGSNPQIKYQTVEFRDATKNTLEKYYFADNRLCGFTLIGDNSKMMKLTEALNRHTSFTELF
ncbi:MAG: FAD-dependent oxidoreductase [Firmicutes bacterium]|nr:FAD-dependent oxidoreductase [Bacillota bacterium]